MTRVASNVIVAALAKPERHQAAAVELLRAAAANGALFISPVVYAESMASKQPAVMHDFLDMAQIAVAWTMPIESIRTASAP